MTHLEGFWADIEGAAGLLLALISMIWRIAKGGSS